MMLPMGVSSQIDLTINHALVVDISPPMKTMTIRERKVSCKGRSRNRMGDIMYLLFACAIILTAGNSAPRVMAEEKEEEAADGGNEGEDEGTLVAEWWIRKSMVSNVECLFSQNQTTTNTTIDSIRNQAMPSSTGPAMLCCPSAALSSTFRNLGLRPRFFAAADFVCFFLTGLGTMST
jgi:hypothetical protein